MPNWCANDLVVSGPKRERNRFVARVKTGDLCFNLNKILPMPLDVDQNWAVNHWGTKWNLRPDGAYLERLTDREVYSLDTAWSPIGELVLLKMTEEFPTLKFTLEFREESMGFAGSALAGSGVLYAYETHDYFPDSDENQDCDQCDCEPAQEGSDDPHEN